MAHHVQPDFPSLNQHQHQERVDAVNLVLADMQKLLPTEIESNTLAAMRDYMVTELGQFELFDKLLLRNASIKLLIKDATDRLIQLQKQAQDLKTDLDVGGTIREEFLQTNSLSRENAALKAHMVVRDAEFMNLRTENQLLEQSLMGYKDILRRNVERREQAGEMVEIQQRGNELEEKRTIIRELNKECERTKHILDGVEAERDRAKNTLRHQHREVRELRIRLREIEKLYQAFRQSRQSRQDPTDTLLPQKPAAAEGGMSASSGIDTSTGEEMQGLTLTNSQTTNPYRADLLGSGSGSGSRFTFPENLGQSVRKEAKTSENCIEAKTAMKSPSGETSVKKPHSPRTAIPIMPLLPPERAIGAVSPKKQEQNGTQSQEIDNTAPGQASSKAQHEP